MKKIMCVVKIVLPAVAALLAPGCGLLDSEGGAGSGHGAGCELCIRIDEDALLTRGASALLPDTNSFILSISASDGRILYEGPYSRSPQSIMVEPDTYHIRIVSSEFAAPSFDFPLFGDDQYVKLSSGQRADVVLVCRMMNCGVKLKIASSFLTDYPDGALVLSSSDGSLMYGYREDRTAYFREGEVRLVLTRGAVDETLLRRSLSAGEILTLNINTASQDISAGSICVKMDTTCTYLTEDYTIGRQDDGSHKGASIADALTISQAKASVGCKDVWVGGFIVGGDMSSKSMSFTPPFSSSTHIGIGPRENTSTKDACIAVSLPSSKVRDDLNLASHPSLLGQWVYVKGDIVASYFGITGIKNVTQYAFK